MSDTGLPGPSGPPSDWLPPKPSDKQLLINWRLARMRLNFFKRRKDWRADVYKSERELLSAVVRDIEHEIDRRGLWYA